MKAFIIGIAALLLCIMFYIFQHDYRQNRNHLNNLKVVCEEASVAGALFIDKTEYSNGRIVFNRPEALKAIEATIKEMLGLDGELNPVQGSYWTDHITYKAYFYDDSNTVYPYLFTEEDTGYTHLVKHPCVIVTINAGNARYHLSFLQNQIDNVRTSAHVWEGR